MRLFVLVHDLARALVVDVHDGVAAKERHGDLELLVFLVGLDDGAREVLKGTGQEGGY